MKLFEFFSEDNGRLSNMRLMAWQSVTVGCAIASLMAYRNTISPEGIGLVLALIGAGFTGKVIQKPSESPKE